MKKLYFFLLSISLLLCLCSCSYSDPVIRSLPEYDDKAYYTSGGFEYITDYIKYTYSSISARDLNASDFFHMVSQEDKEELSLYIDDFEHWVSVANGNIGQNYDFEISTLTEDDFFCLRTKYGLENGQGDHTYGVYDYYYLYIFDSDTNTLYNFKSRQNSILTSIGRYTDKQLWSNAEIADITCYGIYKYQSPALEDNPYFTSFTESYIDYIYSYIDNFEKWIDTYARTEPEHELVLNYSFDRSIIDTEDYIYIEPDSDFLRFTSYDVWFFDAQTSTLYYFHNNI